MIYDCFTFFNELDLLEIRLHILNPVVDRFVLVEATRTHQGKEKPLHYSLNKERFKAFHHKMVHVVVDDYPTFFSKWRMPTSWDLERHQRKAIRQGLKDCNPDDTIIVSDLDEIPNPNKIQNFMTSPGLKVFKQRNYYHYLNYMSLNESEKWWYGPVMAQYADFKSPQDLRSVSKKMHADGMRITKNKTYRFFKSLVYPIYRKQIMIIEEGGWHFSYLGGIEQIIKKLEAFAHSEYNKEEFKDRTALLAAIKAGKDIFGRELEYTTVPIDNSYPAYILENKHRLMHLVMEW